MTTSPAMSEAAPVLEAQGLTVSWEGAPVLADVSLSVDAGQLVCLVGRSGSGKSTLFHALAGLSVPDEGRVLLEGRDVTGRPGSVAYMLQKDLLLPERTVLDNVALPLLLKGVPKAEARDRASERFGRFSLEGSQRLYPSQLSGGMRQRAALLRTCLMDDPVVLMDEPFSALDAFTRQDMRAWLLGLVDAIGLTVLLVTHDVDEAVALADRILVLAGDPVAGVPSRIAGEVDVACPRADREEFMLSSAALEAKREVLALL